MKLFKRFFLIVMIICSVTMLGGCVYTHNKSWDDMSAEEKQKVKQDLEEMKDELSNDYPKNDLTESIINKFEQAIDSAD